MNKAMVTAAHIFYIWLHIIIILPYLILYSLSAVDTASLSNLWTNQHNLYSMFVLSYPVIKISIAAASRHINYARNMVQLTVVRYEYVISTWGH